MCISRKRTLMTDTLHAFPADLAHERAIIRACFGRTYKRGNQGGGGIANERHAKTNGNPAQLAATAILDEMLIEISDQDWECLCALLDAGTPVLDAIRMAVFDVVNLTPRGSKIAALTGRIWK